MHPLTKIAQAIVAKLERSVERDKKARAAALMAAAALDEVIREADEAITETERLIRALNELIERDPHAARTPLPAPPPLPPGATPPRGLTPPPRKR